MSGRDISLPSKYTMTRVVFSNTSLGEGTRKFPHPFTHTVGISIEVEKAPNRKLSSGLAMLLIIS
jgi:hypothetical protein